MFAPIYNNEGEMYMKKICMRCKEEKDIGEFFGGSAWCSECMKNIYKPKEYVLDDLKTPCRKCGETRLYILDFHHIDPKEKEFSVADVIGRGNKSIAEEAKKCICLCANCHREFHHRYGRKMKEPKAALEEYLSDT